MHLPFPADALTAELFLSPGNEARNSVCVCVCVFPYNTLCKLFWTGLCSTCVQNIVFRLICTCGCVGGSVLYNHCKCFVFTESTLEERKNPLSHRGTGPASVLHLDFLSNALTKLDLCQHCTWFSAQCSNQIGPASVLHLDFLSNALTKLDLRQYCTWIFCPML